VSTDREVTRIVRSWLEEGVTALPDRVLDAVFDQVPATRQRRALWPARRFAQMNVFAKIAAAAVAVVVVAVIGLNVMPRNVTVGGAGGTTPTPSPTATAPSASPKPGSLTVSSTGPIPMGPGTYTAADPFPVKLSFTLPAGWGGNIGGPYAVWLAQTQGSGEVGFSILGSVYADPCHYKGLLAPQPGPSVDDLANALANVPGLGSPTPIGATLDRYTGKRLTLTAPASFAGCTLSPDQAYRVWDLPLGATNDLVAGEQDRVWILQVGGQRIVIDTPEPPGQTAATKAEVQAILDSLTIAP
jgi:hypothetical protein